MLHEHIQFYEGTLIKEHLNALAGCHLALRVLLLDAGLTASETDLLLFGLH